MNANTPLSPKFLDDLQQVYATQQPQELSAAFLSDLKQVYATLPVPSDDKLRFLAHRLDEWRRKTKEFVHTRRKKLPEDDPLKCRISLFGTMDYGRLEKAHTRTLAWLLNPEGEHGFGNTLLAALLRRLSGNDCTPALQVKRVVSELPIDGAGAKGRLDVLAEGTWEGERGSWVLVIEAKVDEQEREDQLPKYEKWLGANAAGREVFRVFLTPDGREPETGTEEWEPLSFLELVQAFRAVYVELRGEPGFHFLRFYLAGVLQDICGYREKVAENTIDPYAVVAYLEAVGVSKLGGTSS